VNVRRLVVQSCSDAAGGTETSSGSVHSDAVSRLETELDCIEQVISRALSLLPVIDAQLKASVCCTALMLVLSLVLRGISLILLDELIVSVTYSVSCSLCARLRLVSVIKERELAVKNIHLLCLLCARLRRVVILLLISKSCMWFFCFVLHHGNMVNCAV